MNELGFNYRMTDIQAALGNSQLKKLPAFNRRRREIRAHYNEAFKDLPNVTIPWEAPAWIVVFTSISSSSTSRS